MADIRDTEKPNNIATHNDFGELQSNSGWDGPGAPSTTRGLASPDPYSTQMLGPVDGSMHNSSWMSATDPSDSDWNES
jgi:hypothetical protein